MGTDLSADSDDVLVHGDCAGHKACGQLKHLLIIPDHLDPPELSYDRPIVAPCDRLGLCARQARRTAGTASLLAVSLLGQTK